MQRREFLRLTGSACLDHANTALAQPNFPPEEGLDALAHRTGRRFGFAVQSSYADKEPVLSLLKQHAGVITAELAMKWNIMENIFGVPDYDAADKVTALASNLGAVMRGHTLAWHQSTPAYLTNVSPEQFIAAQTAHVLAMTQRFKGSIHTWDVLNEVIDADTAHTHGMRTSVLSKLWGADRYPELFEMARVADPKAKLAYNDYGMEQDEPSCDARRGVLLRLLENWVIRGTPLDVMGLQAHLDLSRRFSAQKLLQFFDKLQSLGLSIQITELDVRDASNSGGPAARDRAVAALYKDFMDACLSHPAVEMVVMWNVTDGDSWINRWKQGQRRADGLPQRPLLFDAQGLQNPHSTPSLQVCVKQV